MNKKKLLTLAVIVFTSLFCLVILSFNAFKVKAELIVPEDYEYVDTWDDSYLLTNLDLCRVQEFFSRKCGPLLRFLL